MWLPFALSGVWWTESNDDKIKASDQDGDEREFEFLFYLENPPARRFDVDLRCDGDINKTVTDSSGQRISVMFYTSEKNRLARIGCKLTSADRKIALKYCWDTISELMSIWSIKTGSGFSIYAFRVLDAKHDVKWRVFPQQAGPEPFFIPSEIGIRGEYAAMFSLYREARNSQSPFYRFLCCYKILEAWYRCRDIFGEADRLIKEHNLPFRRPKRSITKEDIGFTLILNRHPEFEGKRYGRAFEMLNDWRRQVAHALTNAGQFINLDVHDTLIEASAFADCVDKMANTLLIDEIGLWQQINSANVKAAQAKE